MSEKSLTLTLVLHEHVEERTFHALGRHGFKVPILPSPKDSVLTQTVLMVYQYKEHLRSKAKIQSLLG